MKNRKMKLAIGSLTIKIQFNCFGCKFVGKAVMREPIAAMQVTNYC